MSDMKKIDKSMAITLGLISYYKKQDEKYAKLELFVEQVKQQRNQAQDDLKEAQEKISALEEQLEKMKKST